MATTAQVITYRDAIENVNRFIGGSAMAAAQEDARQAIQSAYLQLVQDRQWKYLNSIERIQLYGVVSEGTIEYLHTGGTYARQITLDGSTWPDWAPFGELWIDNSRYRIDELKTTTKATLEARFNPGEDIAAGTEYQLVQTQYTLPPYFSTGDELNFVDSTLCPRYVSAADLLGLQQFSQSTGTPTHYTIIGVPELLGQLALLVHPAPDHDLTADLVIRRRGSDLKLDGYQSRLIQGRVSTTAGSDTITGNGTQFTSDMVGAIIRMGSGSAVPTGSFGMNPYVQQRSIAEVLSTSSIRVDTTLSDALSNVAYVISDPVDLDPDMVSAFYRGCELQMCYARDLKRLQPAIQAYTMALSNARAADHKSTQVQSAGMDYPYRPRLAELGRPGFEEV